ncbi:imidazoleglycerol-phosphate dehydratase HisB [Breznakiella homolactica]|uniref:Imidazoleglycerol-phosphate dehydratase n=1 Tax=Breznakiella homolactica TaxID=2798577 RepID=A0A7T8BBP6_9SPIR|nr:imidazoleglycerol-phosphate dehydratase HisB [Breznakiella homolactica]QQO10611.1 imidazoleglycerol-phosphate dehydratase HisB [Breznakiella homolactica]
METAAPARTAEISRKTNETDIYVKLTIDGTGESRLDIPVGFMVHMLTTFAKHGLFDLEIRAAGDLEVDQHHLVEDLGIVLGQCFAKALGEKRGIRRIGSCLFPMDETLARAAVDLSGRPFLVFEGALSGMPLVSGTASFQTDTAEDFWQGFAVNAGCALHLDVLRGRSDHHRLEALFKAAARSLRDACEIDPRAASVIPSTKGVLA